MINKLYRLFFPGKSDAELREIYNIPTNMKFTLDMCSDGFIVMTSEELPGFIAEARNSGEILDALNEATMVYFDIPKKEGDIVFPQFDIEGHGTISYADKKLKVA